MGSDLITGASAEQFKSVFPKSMFLISPLNLLAVWETNSLGSEFILSTHFQQLIQRDRIRILSAGPTKEECLLVFRRVQIWASSEIVVVRAEACER